MKPTNEIADQIWEYIYDRDAEIECLEKRVDTLQERIAELEAENKRLKLSVHAKISDHVYGIPCEQVRHEQEVEGLREEIDRLTVLAEERGKRMEVMARKLTFSVWQDNPNIRAWFNEDGSVK